MERSFESLAEVSADEDYGLGWWVSRSLPGLVEANGRGGQRISLVPDQKLVIVMTGGGFEPGDVGAFLLQAVKGSDPLPDDPVGRARLAEALETAAVPPPAWVPRLTGGGSRVRARL